MKRLQLDLKAPEGKATFLRLAAERRRGARELPPRRRRPARHRLRRRAAVNPDIVYCSTSGYGQTGPASQWAGHDINYLGVGGYLDCSERAPGNKPPLPGATVADAAGGGMQAAMAIMAALVRRATTGEGSFLDVSIADGVLVADGAVHRRVPGHRHRARSRPLHPHRPLRLLRHLPVRRRPVGRGRRDRAGVLPQPLPAARLRRVGRPPDGRRGRRTRSGPPSGPPSLAGPATSGWPSWPGRHVRRAGLLGARAGRRPADRRPRPDRRGRPRHRGPVPPARHAVWPAPTPSRHEFRVRDGAVTDTDELLAAAGLTSDEIAALREGGVVA